MHSGILEIIMVSKAKDLCPRCAQRKLVTDIESGEMFCSKCGFVITEKLQEAGPEWRSFAQDEGGNKAKSRCTNITNNA